MKLLRLILALFLYALPASAATYISGDPTGGANGTSYADMNEWRGDGVDSTYIAGSLDLSNRQYVRLSNLTINGNLSLDSLSRAVVLDSVKINGDVYFTSADSCALKNATVIGAQIRFGAASLDSVRNVTPSIPDTLYPDWISNCDTLMNVRAILTPGQDGIGWLFRGVSRAFVSAVNCSVNCRAGKRAGAAKFFITRASTFQNTSWRIRNDDDVANEESGYWCLRDLSSWNTFTQDTVWQTGTRQTTLALSHSGICSWSNWCDKQRDNLFDRCWFVNFSAQGGSSRIIYQQFGLGDQFLNCVFAARGDAFNMLNGTLDGISANPFRMRHCTFFSFNDGRGVVWPESPTGLQNLVFTDNVVYAGKPGETWEYVGASWFRVENSAAVDTMNFNLYYRPQDDSCMFVRGQFSNPPNTYKSRPGTSGRLYSDTGLEAASTWGSPRFTDSTASYSFNPTPLATSYALKGSWRHSYVGALPKAIVDSLPVAPDSIYYASNGTRVRVAFRIPRDDHGVTGWELYRSTTNVASYKDATQFMSDYRISSEPFTQGMEIVSPEVKQKANQTWYWYVVVRDSDGQYSAQTTKAITTTSGGGSWSWPP